MTTQSSLVRFLGDTKAHRENVIVAVLMLLVTAGYEYISMLILPDFHFNMYEFVGTWSGLVTVWLSRTENILCWPWGIVSAAALGYFFMAIGLPGQQWLNWGYFLVIQFWAWPYWAFGGKERDMLQVSALSVRGRVLSVLAIVLGTWAVYHLIDILVPGSRYPVLDATVVASSVVAQYLLGKKNIESWVLWLGPVNLLSIILFYSSGAYTVMALYIAFLIHAVFALRSWGGSITHA